MFSIVNDGKVIIPLQHIDDFYTVETKALKTLENTEEESLLKTLWKP